jgi:hypothetical protein
MEQEDVTVLRALDVQVPDAEQENFASKTNDFIRVRYRPVGPTQQIPPLGSELPLADETVKREVGATSDVLVPRQAIPAVDLGTGKIARGAFKVHQPVTGS